MGSPPTSGSTCSCSPSGSTPNCSAGAAKFFQLVRLIPFVERNYNLVELGPKGTGKSHIFSEFSPHGMLISGGEVTVPKLFVNNSNGRIGLVGYWDVVAFDEFAGKKKRTDKALVDIMKNYMANKSFSRGIETLGAEASMVFVGNTSHTVPYMLKNSDLFDELPEAYHDPAYLDRLHHYIPGWEVDIIRGEMFSNGYGFVVDYIAEVLKSMRSKDYSDRYQQYFTLSPDISTRDRDGIHKTFSGLMKILYPAWGGRRPRRSRRSCGSRSKAASASRTRSSASTRRWRTSSSDTSTRTAPGTASPRWRKTSTRPTTTVRHKETEPEELPEAADPLGGGAASADAGSTDKLAEPEDLSCSRGTSEYQEGQRGVSYDTLLVPYLVVPQQITIVDPYVRSSTRPGTSWSSSRGSRAAKDAADEVA